MDINLKKLENAILFFINKSGGRIDRMKLMKLLWLSDRLHLAKYGRLILKDRYKALPKGPVPSLGLDISQKGLPNGVIVIENEYKVCSETPFDNEYFSKSDLKIMNYVWDKFKNISSHDFSEYSHKYPEWMRYESLLNKKYTPNSYDIVIQDFFEFPDLEEFSDILDKEEISLSKEEFNIKNSIQSILD